MNILIADDEMSMWYDLKFAVERVAPSEENEFFFAQNYDTAVEQIQNNHINIAFLDINMPGKSGLELAQAIKSLNPDINIIMVTAYREYALDALQLYVSAYLLKPVDDNELREALDNLRKPVERARSVKPGLTVKCFGNFEVFGRDGIVEFGRSLSKEAFAYLIDRRGAGCTVAEICAILWEDRTADKGLKSQCRVVMGALKKDLEKVGAGNVIVKNWNTWGIDTNKVDCDYYCFLRGDSGAVNSFRGEYMSQYSWAEMTVGRLFDITEEVAVE